MTTESTHRAALEIADLIRAAEQLTEGQPGVGSVLRAAADRAVEIADALDEIEPKAPGRPAIRLAHR